MSPSAKKDLKRRLLHDAIGSNPRNSVALLLSSELSPSRFTKFLVVRLTFKNIFVVQFTPLLLLKRSSFLASNFTKFGNNSNRNLCHKTAGVKQSSATYNQEDRSTVGISESNVGISASNSEQLHRYSV